MNIIIPIIICLFFLINYISEDNFLKINNSKLELYGFTLNDNIQNIKINKNRVHLDLIVDGMFVIPSKDDDINAFEIFISPKSFNIKKITLSTHTQNCWLYIHKEYFKLIQNFEENEINVYDDSYHLKFSNKSKFRYNRQYIDIQCNRKDGDLLISISTFPELDISEKRRINLELENRLINYFKDK